MRSSGILEREERLVVDRFDETRAEERNRNAPRDDVDFRRHDRLAAVRGIRKEMDRAYRAACRRRRWAGGSDPVRRGTPARTSETRLTPPTAGTLWQTAQLAPLNAGPEPFFGRLDLEKVVEPDPETFELGRKNPRQRIAELRERAPAPADRPAITRRTEEHATDRRGSGHEVSDLAFHALSLCCPA